MADFLSTVARMFRARQKNEKQKQTALGSRESRMFVKPTEKKKDTGKAFTNEEIYRIMNASRLPIQQQKSYYEINPELRKRVKERTKVAFESRPALVGAMEGLNPISGLNTLQGAVGKVDVSETTKSAPYLIGNALGQAGQYMMTGGLAQAGVANAILKGSQGIGKKLAANAAADIITGVPLNVAESLKTAKTPEEFAKNFAVNTAFDVGIGAAVGGASSAIKAIKANKATKPIADALEKGGYVKDAKEAEIKMQQAVKNVVKEKKVTQPIQPSTPMQPTQPVPSTEVPLTEAPIGQKITTPIVGTKQNIVELQQKMDNLMGAVKPEPVPVSKMIQGKAQKNVVKKEASKFAPRRPIKDSFNDFYTDTVNGLEPFERVAKKTNDSEVLNQVDALRKIKSVVERNVVDNQTDEFGNAIGKSINEITQDVRNYMPYDVFDTYRYVLAHLDMVKQGRELLEGLELNEATTILRNIIRDYPEVVNLKAEFDAYNNNLTNMMVREGLMSPEELLDLQAKYPNYATTYRDRDIGSYVGTNSKSRNVDSFRLNAKKGGDLDILPGYEQLAIKTEQVRKAIEVNRLMKLKQLRDSSNLSEGKAKIGNEQDETTLNLDSMLQEGTDGNKYFHYFENGKPVKMKVDEETFRAMKQWMNPPQLSHTELRLKEVNNVFKSLITGWNTFFATRNFPKDIGDVAFYSKDLPAFIKTMVTGKSVKELNNPNSLYAKAWYDAGGGGTISGLDKDLNRKSNALKRATLDNIEKINMYIERVPRITEFIATVDKSIAELNAKGLKNADGTPRNIKSLSDLTPKEYQDIVRTATRNASEITVEFERGGTGRLYTHIKNGTPFLQPSIQGTDRFVRQLTGADGWKGYARLLIKLGFFGVAPAVVNELIYRNDKSVNGKPSYNELSERDRNMNYLFKLPNGDFFKIPKGRVMALVSTIPQSIVRNRKGQLDNTLGTNAKIVGSNLADTLSNMGPINPITGNIAYPIISSLWLNRNWWGGEIETTADEKKAISERWDSKTSEISKLLGKIGIVSPKKLDYIIGAYTGIIGDLVLPIFTRGLNRGQFGIGGVFKQNYLIDPTYQNKLSTEFYDSLKKFEQAKNSPDATIEYELYFKYLNKFASDASDIRAEIETIQKSPMENELKAQKVEELQQQLNNLYQGAMVGYDAFETFLQDAGVTAITTDETFKRAFLKTTADGEWATTKDTSTVDNELDVLYDDLNSIGYINKGAVYPTLKSDDILKLGEKSTDASEVKLTKAQVDSYNKLFANESLSGIETLIDSNEYKIATPTEKVKLVSDVYSDARHNAKIKTLIDAGKDEWKVYTDKFSGSKKDYSALKNAGVRAIDYYNAFKDVNLDDKASISRYEAYTKLESLNLTREQKALMWSKYSKSWKDSGNPYLGGSIPTPPSEDGTTSGSSTSKTSAVAKAYRDGLATKQVQSLKNINIDSPNITKAELKAIIKMLSA